MTREEKVNALEWYCDNKYGRCNKCELLKKYDKETKEIELVKFEESIDDYMDRAVLPHIPDAVAFFEENLGAKKPVVKTGAEIPFIRYFYKYQEPVASEELETRFLELEMSISARVAKLFE